MGDYRENGKEFGLSNKGAYWIYFILLVVFSMIIDFLTNLLFIPLASVTPIILAIGIEAATIKGILSVFRNIIATVVQVPMMGYSMDLVANTEEGVGSRLGRNLKKLNLNTVLATLSTSFITWMPTLGIYVLMILASVLKGIPIITMFLALGVFIGGILFLYETVKRTILYMLVPYILALEPETKGYTARKLSEDLMVAHFSEAFMLGLKLFFVALSGIFIIPLIWAIPYVFSTYTFFAFERLSEGGFIDFDEESEEDSEE